MKSTGISGSENAVSTGDLYQSHGERVLFFPFNETAIFSLKEAQNELSRAATTQLPFDLTLVVSIFNTRCYLLDCLRSALLSSQRLRLQLICVNDGSSDDSLQLVSSFLRDHDLRSALILDQPNRGPGAARNVALPLVCGEFVASLDSDDVVDPLGYSVLAPFAKEFDCDVVWGRTTVFSDDLRIREKYSDAPTWEWILEGREAVVIWPRFDPRPFLIEVQPNARVINSEFLRSHQILYPSGFWEDVPFHYQLLHHADRVGFVDATASYYRLERPGQTIGEKSQRRFQMINVFKLSLDSLLKSCPSIEHGAAFVFMMAHRIFWCSRFIPLSSREEYFKTTCEAFKRVPKSWLDAFFSQFRTPIAFVVWCMAQGQLDALSRQSANARSPWPKMKFRYQVYGLYSMSSYIIDGLRLSLFVPTLLVQRIARSIFAFRPRS
jgi:hypothetical protein